MKPPSPVCSIDAVRAAATFCALLWLMPATAQAAGTFNLVSENDSYVTVSGDRHYTNGAYFSWTSDSYPDGENFARHLMLPGAKDASWRHGYFLGQAIFTPQNLTSFIPPANDRPYAGWLFAGARLYRDSGDRLDKIEATLGVVGPMALGGDVQRAWHAAFIPSAVQINGWHAQLRDEPGLVLSQQRIWRVPLTDGRLRIEALPQANIAVGNIYDYAGAGVTLRFGHNLAADWGPPRIAPAQQGSDFQDVESFAWYVYAGGEMRAMARNLFLDGNSFHAGPSVSKKSLVGDFNTGAALLFPHVRVTAGYTLRGTEFRGQKGNDEIGSLTVSFIP
ncbi:MAG TPA: lipid A deacylase LpxR family protein [Rhizomicrobium sp.]|nr:lipid A deacylase LpxR family protein [Rhizomicrobium sp.]